MRICWMRFFRVLHRKISVSRETMAPLMRAQEMFHVKQTWPICMVKRGAWCH